MCLKRVLYETAAGKSGLSGLLRCPVGGVRLFLGRCGWMKKILLLVLLVCLLPVAAMGEIVDSGTCGAQGDNLTWTLDDAGKLTISGTGAMKEFANDSASPWYNNKSSILSVEIQSGVTSIGSRAFLAYTGLENLTVEGSVSSIGKNAFQLTSLKKVTIPCSDLQIGDNAFQSCSSLESVTLEGSVSSIGKYAFQGTSLKSLTLSCSDLQIGESAFSQTGLESVTLEGSVSSIGKYAFLVTSLKKVTIPCSDLQIGESAFQNCSSLESVTLDGNVSSIGAYAFYGTSLKRLTLSCSDLQIGAYAFYLCSSLESVTLEGSISSIGDSAFRGTSLKSVRIPCSDLQIGAYAFYSCSSLESVTLDGSVSSIGESAFESCAILKSVRISCSDLQIGDYAFYCCSSLESVTLDGSVVSIGEHVFYGCGALADIWYCGTQEKWDSITKGSSWVPATPEIHTFTFAGTGKETDAYKIQTEVDWNTLAVFIEEGSFDTAGKHFQLEASGSLSVSKMIGAKDNPFKGIFDGKGKTLTLNYTNSEDKADAPFAWVNGATICNLLVDGKITGSANGASGLIGENENISRVVNCRVAAELHGGKLIGGFCVGTGDNGIQFEGCVFNGKIEAGVESSGFVAWVGKGSDVRFSNCVCAPYDATITSGGPFYYNYYYALAERGTVTLDNCYYFMSFGTAQGKLPYRICPGEGVTFEPGEGKIYDVSGITAFPEGVSDGEHIFAAEGDEMSLHLRYDIPEGKYVRYYVNDMPLTRGAGDAWMMTMLGEDVTIRAEISPIEQYGRPTFRLPTGTRSIGENAFAGIKAAVVYVPDKCSKVEANAFKDCPNLKQIRLPKDCEIDDAAFYGCTNLMAIYSSGDGTTKDWAEENGYGYMTAK